MMTHEEIRELIHPYADGELDVVNAREIEQHLTGCDDCRRLEQRVQLLRMALRNNAPAYRAPARLRKNVRRALKREAKPERESFSPWLVLTTGAAFALLLLSFAFYQTTRTSRNVIADELVANHVRSPARDPPGRRGLVRPAHRETVVSWESRFRSRSA